MACGPSAAKETVTLGWKGKKNEKGKFCLVNDFGHYCVRASLFRRGDAFSVGGYGCSIQAGQLDGLISVVR